MSISGFSAAWAGFNRTRRRYASSGRSLNSQLREKLRLSATLANVGTATSSGGRPLFEDFSLRIAAGERVGLVGESGRAQVEPVCPPATLLLHRSVRENIRYGHPNATDHPVRAAARAAQCDFIEDLPAGFATIVRTRGLNLSGGQ